MSIPIQLPGRRGLGLTPEMSLDEAVQIAVGAASVAWSNVSGAGEFDTRWAIQVSEELTSWVRDNVRRLCSESANT